MRKLFPLLCAFAALTLSGAANAQGVRIGNASSAPVSTATLLSTKVLVPVPNAVVQFCNAPANAVPCTNKIVTYSDSTLGTPCATSTQVVLDGTSSCVAATDSLGNWGVWVPAGIQYAYTFTSTAGNFGPYYVTGTLVSGVQYSGSILATQVPFGTALNTISGSPNLTWDNTTKSLTATNSGSSGTAPLYGIATGVTVSSSGIVGNCQQLANFACNGGQFTAGDSGAGPIGSIVGISGVPSHLATGTLGTLTGLDLNATVGVGAGAITTSRGIHVGGATFPAGTSPVTHSGIVIDDQCAGGFPATTCSGLNVVAQSNGKPAAVFAGAVNTTLALNGTCIVSATQTLQACINTFPSGNGDIFIPLGTWSSTATITINGNAQSNIRITGAGRNSIIKYTGGGVIQAVIDIGTSTPTVQLLSSIILRDFTISGNANSVHAIRLQGVQTSTLQDIDGRDVTGSALQWLFGTGNRINHWITSATDGIGSFSPVPTGCLELGELGSTTFGFTTTTIDTPRCESVSGTAIKMTNAQVNTMTAAQISTVGTALDIEPGAGAVSSLQNSFTSSLFENSSNADGMIINGLQTHFYDSQMATLGVGKLHIKASNNFIEGGQVGTAGITIDAGVKNTHIHHLSMTPTLLTDNGTATQLVNNFDPGTGGPWVVNGITNKEVIPASGVVSDLPTSDPMDHANRGCWKFIGTAATVISPTVMTTGKPWRALFQGVWENDTDGAGLAQLAEEQDVTSVANTLVIGTITVTFTVNGSGQFQGVNSASNTMFCGTITMNPNPNGAVGTSSMTLKGGVSTTQINMTGAGSAVDFNVVSSNAFRNNSAGGSYFFDLGNATFRNGDSTPGGTVNFSGQVLPTVVNTSDLGSAALPFRALWLGTAATNNFKFQPAATAAARVISIPDPLAAENLALIDTMTVNFVPKAASSSTSRLSPTLESDDGTTMTYTGTGGYSAPRLISTVATGTAPLTITSTTAVANLKVQNLSAVSGGDLPSAAGGTDVGSTALPYGNLWLGTAATNNFKFQPAATSGARIVTMADPLSPTTVALPLTIGSGTTTLTANAALAAVTAQAANTTAATGVLTTDAIEWSFASAPTAGDSLCHVLAYVTAGNVNFIRANPTAAPQNVSALVVNWRVIR